MGTADLASGTTALLSGVIPLTLPVGFTIDRVEVVPGVSRNGLDNPTQKLVTRGVPHTLALQISLAQDVTQQPTPQPR